MIGSMRTKTNRTLVWIILGLLMLGLTGFGIGGVGGGTVRSIGSVGDEKIAVQDYTRALDQEMRRLSAQFGQNISFSQAQAFGLDQAVLQQVLSTAALNNEASRLGLSVGDETVRAALLANPSFQGIDGKFDKTGYEFTLDRIGLSPAEYDAILRKETSRGLLAGAVSGGIESGNSQALALLAFSQESRDFSWAEITDSMLTTPIAEPNDAEILAQYTQTPAAYTALESREITYAHLSPDMLGDQVEIDEARIQESFDLQSDRFNRPERRMVERIVFSAQQEAEEARTRLDGEAISFEELAAERGLNPEDINLGEVETRDMEKAAADLVFAAEGPGIVGPVDSALGPALFRINAILSEQITSIDDAREEILAELQGEAARRLVADLVTDIDDLLAAGATIEELATDTDMVLGTLSFTAETEDGISAYEAFRLAAGNAQLNDFPEVKTLSDGGVFALRLDKIIPPSIKPLETVRDQVISDWKRKQTLKQLTTIAEQAKLHLEKAGSFEAFSLAKTEETGITRGGFIEETPPLLASNIFDLEPLGVTVVSGTESIFVGRLDAIHEFDPDQDGNAEILSSVRQQVDTQISSDLFQLYATALQNSAGVQIDQNALNAVTTQLQTGQ